MEGTDYSQRQEMPPQRLVLENQKNPSKFKSHFLCKALSVAIVLVILPLFPSQAPDFINQTVFTRSWELLHLLFVGIAVSYGLFSRRNVESDNEDQLKIDSTQTYMSRILQVSSVFDDDVETPVGSDENKTQTWNSKYSRRTPLVVVEKDNTVLDEESATISNVSNKPLFLPVRSLRSSVSDSDSIDSVGESIESLGSKTRSSGSSERSRTREFDDLDHLDLEEKVKESVVLPSPIPWRSRSGRMEMKEEVGDCNPPPPSVDEPEFRSFSSPIHASPKRLSPSSSLSPEMQARNVEDLGKKKKNASKSSPPPPPPLPTPLSRTSPSNLRNSRSSEKRSFRDELKDLSKGGRREDFPRETNHDMDYSEGQYKTQFEASSTGKSVRTNRGSEPTAEARNFREFEERSNEKSEERPRRKAGGFNQQLTSPTNQNSETSRPSPKPTLPKYQKKEKKKLAQKVILESEEYSSSETDDIHGSSDTEKATSGGVTDARPDPNEVDKKADEFIAKFREQIRLQRIESIKRSSGQYR